MTQPIGPLRWYAGLAVVFFGIVPAVLVTMLVIRGNTPGQVGLLLIGGIPLVLAAIFYAVRGFGTAEPEPAAKYLNRSMALVAGADVLLLGGNALIRMATG
ncbi:hypothetical protein OHA21_19950 [Actinoplanes sp. NBC_00393]|uniref:hypothetical protein n=1 Tax=Actinoplanes sp. NBC_00393 TaxID=2975953 RepID=UPI002E1DBDB3